MAIVRVYTSNMSESEQKTIHSAAQGDRLAFRELVLQHSHAMFRLAWRMTRDEGIAEDIVQESFIKAWHNLPEFRGESSFRSWLHRITVNSAMDVLRKQASRKKYEIGEPEWEGLEQATESPRFDAQIDIRRHTEMAMKQLTETEQAALLLRHFEGHSINEIAGMLELTSGACKQTIFRAVAKMRTALQPLVANP